MLKDVIDELACAACGRPVALADGAVRCEGGHSFDVARQGYVSMLAGRRGHSGDDARMVEARERFLSAGHLDPVALGVVEAAVAAAGTGCVVDVGAGTGHYLARVLDALPGRPGIAVDASAAALRRAARCHERAGAVAADVWSVLPVRTGAAGIVLDVFAPRNAAEMHRVLAPDGALVVATPTERHLAELVTRLGLLHVDESKERRVEETLGPRFDETSTRVVEHQMLLGPAAVADVVAMGPSAHHVSPDLSALADPMPVTSSVRVSTYRPRP